MGRHEQGRETIWTSYDGAWEIYSREGDVMITNGRFHDVISGSLENGYKCKHRIPKYIQLEVDRIMSRRKGGKQK